MKMFTAKEKKNLASVLSRISNQENCLCLEELHGLFFGIAITPELIMPGEWLPAVLGEEMNFDDERDAELCVGYIVDAYNRIIDTGNKGKLVFLFEYHRLIKSDYSLIEDWTRGLFLGLSLRSHIWKMSRECENIENKKIPPDIQKVIDSYDIIATIAVPEERVGIYEPIPGLPARSPEEVMEMLYIMLPAAVETLRQHGAKLKKENQGLKPPVKKTARSKSSPAESGKKNKKAPGKTENK